MKDLSILAVWPLTVFTQAPIETCKLADFLQSTLAFMVSTKGGPCHDSVSF